MTHEVPQVVLDVAEKYGVDERKVKDFLSEVIKDVSWMINCFVRVGMYSFADRLANAVGKEVVVATLYEALRISRSTLDSGGTLDENVGPHVANEKHVSFILDLLDADLVAGLDLVKKIAVRALALPPKKE